MQLPRSILRYIPVALAILLSGAAYFVSTGLDPIGGFLWIAPVPVLILALCSSWRQAATGAFVAYFLGSLNTLGYLHRVAPTGPILVALAGPALAFMLSTLFTRAAVMRLGRWVGLFAYPAIWIAFEFFLSIVSPHGTFGSIAYTQARFLPVIQIASLTGIWGISFLLMFIPSGIAISWHFRKDKPAVLPVMVLSTGLLALAYGWARLMEPEGNQRVRVGLAATDLTIRHFRSDQATESLPVINAYSRRALELASRGAQVVVLPEKFAGVAPYFRDEAYRILGSCSRAGNTTIVAGLNLVGHPPLRNIAVVFGPDGRVLMEYDKVHFLPGAEEGYKSGSQPGLLQLPQATAGVAICKDMDFPEWSRRYAQAGVRILFVPAWDFVRDERLHAQMAVMRGIEGGFTVVRTAQQGLLFVSDYRGRILAEEESSRSPEVLIVCDAPLGPGGSLYTRFGNWFAWINLLFLALLVFAAALESRRKSGS